MEIDHYINSISMLVKKVLNIIKSVAVSVLLLCLFKNVASVHALDLEYLGTDTVGATDLVFGIELAKDNDNNIYVVGNYGSGTVDFDPTSGVENHTSNGLYDVFFTKYNSNGSYAWTKTWGGTGTYDDVYDLTIDSANNIYVFGEFNGTVDFDPGEGVTNRTSAGNVDVFVSKFTQDGSFVWVKTFGSTADDRGLYLTVDSQDNLYLTGKFRLTVDFNPGSAEGEIDNHTAVGNYDNFLSKYSSDGSYLWTKTWGNNTYDAPYFIITDASDNLYVGGYFYNTVDLDPGEGTSQVTSAGDVDVFVSKFDSNGIYQKAVTWGGAGGDYVYDAAKNTGGRFYFAGYFSGTTDFDPTSSVAAFTSKGGDDAYVAIYDNNLNYLSVKTWGSTALDQATKLTFDNSGNYYVGGLYGGTVDFDSGSGVDLHTASKGAGFFISFYDENDNYKGSKTPVSTTQAMYQSASGILTVNSVLYLTGCFAGTQDFDPSSSQDIHTSRGIVDFYLTKYLIDDTDPTSFTLESPSNYSNDTRPILSFKKTSAADVSSYSVSLDSGRNLSFLVAGVPSSGDSSHYYIWRDDLVSKIEFKNEEDDAIENDIISVFFKGLITSELTEGKHSWKVIAYDDANNAHEETKDFYIDRTKPQILELSLEGYSYISPNQVYALESNNDEIHFTGLALDDYRGSTKANPNGTFDVFNQVSSGPEKVTLTIQQQSALSNSLSEWADYSVKEYILGSISDSINSKKETRFSIKAPALLESGCYRVEVSLKDYAGNIYLYPSFYLSVDGECTTVPTATSDKSDPQELSTSSPEEESKQESTTGLLSTDSVNAFWKRPTYTSTLVLIVIMLLIFISKYSGLVSKLNRKYRHT